MNYPLKSTMCTHGANLEIRDESHRFITEDIPVSGMSSVFYQIIIQQEASYECSNQFEVCQNR